MSGGKCNLAGTRYIWRSLEAPASFLRCIQDASEQPQRWRCFISVLLDAGLSNRMRTVRRRCLLRTPIYEASSTNVHANVRWSLLLRKQKTVSKLMKLFTLNLKQNLKFKWSAVTANNRFKRFVCNQTQMQFSISNSLCSPRHTRLSLIFCSFISSYRRLIIISRSFCPNHLRWFIRHFSLSFLHSLLSRVLLKKLKLAVFKINLLQCELLALSRWSTGEAAISLRLKATLEVWPDS